MPPQHDTALGSNLLSQIANELVRAQKRYWGKGPLAAKAYMFDDMLFVVMFDGLTVAELTMLEFGQADLVRQFRQTFENEMTQRMTDIVEELSGRTVVTYQSQVLFDPHRVVEIFVFDEPAPEGPRAATAEGQLSDGRAGEATDAEALDPEDATGEQQRAARPGAPARGQNPDRAL